MAEQLWSDARIKTRVGIVTQMPRYEHKIAKLMQEMRDDYEMQLDGYRERAERSPGIISALEETQPAHRSVRGRGQALK